MLYFYCVTQCFSLSLITHKLKYYKMTIKIHGFYSTASNKSGNCWIQNYLIANSNRKYLPIMKSELS